jgi:hypothetical protein
VTRLLRGAVAHGKTPERVRPRPPGPNTARSSRSNAYGLQSTAAKAGSSSGAPATAITRRGTSPPARIRASTSLALGPGSETSRMATS